MDGLDDISVEGGNFLSDLPNVSPFRTQAEVNFRTKDEYKNMTEDDQCAAQKLLWLVPAVIWAYNSYKKSVVEEAAAISKLEGKIKIQNRALTRYNYMPKRDSDWVHHVPLDVSAPFALGTGFALRQGGDWMQYLVCQ